VSVKRAKGVNERAMKSVLSSRRPVDKRKNLSMKEKMGSVLGSKILKRREKVKGRLRCRLRKKKHVRSDYSRYVTYRKRKGGRTTTAVGGKGEREGRAHFQ